MHAAPVGVRGLAVLRVSFAKAPARTGALSVIFAMGECLQNARVVVVQVSLCPLIRAPAQELQRSRQNGSVCPAGVRAHPVRRVSFAKEQERTGVLNVLFVTGKCSASVPAVTALGRSKVAYGSPPYSRK